MYEYIKGNYIYYGNSQCGTPIREVHSVSQKEANYWDKLDRQIRQANKKF